MAADLRVGICLLALALNGHAGEAFEAAEALFRQDPRWLGSDGANSAPLGDGRIYWTFEDTFIATSGRHLRTESTMVRNSIAIQDGPDPLTAKMHFYWGLDERGDPASFFPEDGDSWYWTGGAMRLAEGPLVTFLYRVRAAPGEGLGFANDGFAVAFTENPDDPPHQWRTRITNPPRLPFDAVPATTILRQGDHVVGLALKQAGTHAGALVRYRAVDLARGYISRPEWWGGDGRGWVAQDDLGPAGPAFVIDDAGSECSIHWDERTGSFVHITTYGFGAATIGMRTAPGLTGPWSDPVTVYHPPELGRQRPFIYGAIAHPELAAPGPGELVVTYATNAFEFGDLFTAFGSANTYWPRVITVSLTASAD